MSDLLRGRVAVVTGGASGIGRATVRRFLAEGARVVFGDLHEANAARLVEETADPDRLRFVPTDVTDETSVAALVAAATDGFGGPDILFNNAGVGGAFGPLVEIDAADWDRTFAVISRGMFLGTKHAARAMIARGDGGVIVNNASVAGLGGGGGPTAYSAAKAAVVNFTANAAVELAEHRIRVNAVCPGLVDTPFVMGRDAAAIEARLPTFQPWPELGRAEDIAGLVLYLVGPDSTFLTGAAVRADGGMLAWGPRMTETSDPRGRTRRYTGFTEGTTGRRTVKRPVDGA
ncbi:SDR family oxidoreductase [Yinghuangia sp. ASG 101]|uniref:SDR family NAD(P)-dependent oxidoreductase n=1 Tax=Yinghuangia sp. ASG 101 TaxID=2896848 RepID=UPI001E39551F|nr:SDR family oxidoreductase [Yinghuangia sp. ASG 101]UGQ11874.1 SDR family oxidoreductase [Yinghuangia sp. ASG 101]